MKWLIMNACVMYIVACADNTENRDPWPNRVIQAILWPITVSVWFCCQSNKLHRLLNILWTVLITGWFLSLLADRL